MRKAHKITIMENNLVATAQTTISAPLEKVWDALVNPGIIKQYMFGTTVNSGWTEGSSITWKGEWKGKSYEDKGRILQIIPNQILRYSHFSPLSGLEDKPENYHTVTMDLKPVNEKTQVVLRQDGNADEQAKQHSQKNWEMMLDGMKKVLEGTGQ